MKNADPEVRNSLNVFTLVFQVALELNLKVLLITKKKLIKL